MWQKPAPTDTVSSGGHAPPCTARCPWPPMPGIGALVSVFGAAWQGCPLPAPLEHTPAPRSSIPPGLPHPPPLPSGELGSVTSSLPPMTLRLWSLQPHTWLWGFLLLLQPKTPFAVLKQAYSLLPRLSLVHISAQCCPGPSSCALSHCAPGRHVTFCWPSPLPVAQAAAGQAHGRACVKR